MTTQEFTLACTGLRSNVRYEELRVRELTPFVTDLPDAEWTEVNAHLMLAVRHLEDARMRLGKAIQYATGGDSCYDQEPIPDRGA